MTDDKNQSGGTPEAFLLTIDEAISATRTSRATLYREINSGLLKTVKLGRRRYVTPEFLREWIAGLPDGRET